MKTTLIRGVPMGMQQDGWWLSGHSPRTPPPVQADVHSGRDQLRLLLLVTLIALGDVLVWQVQPGLSLAVFGGALIAGALLALPSPPTSRQTALILGLALLILLPLVELVQPLSILIALVGVSVLLAGIAGVRAEQILQGAAWVWPVGIEQTFTDSRNLIRPLTGDSPVGQFRAAFLGWLLPLGLGGLFILLLTQANPILSRWISGVFDTQIPDLDRMIFWILLIPVGWTVLSVSGMRERLARPGLARPVAFGPHREGVVNQRSVGRGLVLFNAIFAVQTAMDALYLYGGVGLPDGITYAAYTHKGAYPLVVTALMAGAFALLTRSWTSHDATLRLWLMVWVAQNVALVISSLVRLDLYIGVYGLTHLRAWAAIWMVLVATGLGLVIWQVRQGHENRWLLLRCAGLGAGVLYVCAFVSFDALVARYNTTRPVPLDAPYLCELGDAAQPIVETHIMALGQPICANGRHLIRAPQNWREWGFRNWRARLSLTAIQSEASL